MPERFVRNATVEMAPMKEETVLFNPGNNKFCVLNATAAFIWGALEQPRSCDEIVAELVKRFANVSAQRAEQDVQRVLRELNGVECVVPATAKDGA